MSFISVSHLIFFKGKKIAFLLFCFITFLLLDSNETSAQVITIKEKDSVLLIGKKILILADTTGRFSFKEILSDSLQKKFSPGIKDYNNFPATRITYWIKFSVKNILAEDIILRIGNGWIAYIDLFKPGSNGSYDSILTGHFRPFKNREFPINQFWFKLLDSKEKEPKTFYVRLNSSGYILEAPFYLGTYKAMLEQQQQYDWFVAIYVGAIMMMLLYNFFIYISTLDKTYLYYLLYLLIVPIGFVYTKGQYSYFWIYRDFENLNFYYFSLNNFNPVVATLFIQAFLKLKWRDNVLLKIAFILSFLILLLGIWNFISGISGHQEWWLSTMTSMSLQLIVLFYLIFLIIAVKSYFLGIKGARFLLLGWSIFIISIWVLVLSLELEVLPLNFLTRESILIGNLIEIVLFSLALADRINILKAEREKAQNLALIQAKENERIVQQQNVLLEQMVSERTEELQIVNNDLVKKKENLEDLIQEKDGLIGVVAHDLTSPLNSIHGIINISRLENNLPPGLNTYLQMIDKLTLNGKLLIEDLLTISSANKELQYEDISEITIRSFFDEALLPLSKLASDKNISFSYGYSLGVNSFITEQVSLRRILENLVSNAIKFTPQYGKIDIAIIAKDKTLILKIKDTGPGFTEEDRKKMFKKFQRLSARPTSGESSTGLGLAIVKTLCERLGGTIALDTTPNKGSEFSLMLPSNEELLAVKSFY